MCLSKISDYLGDIFRHIYSHLSFFFFESIKKLPHMKKANKNIKIVVQHRIQKCENSNDISKVIQNLNNHHLKKEKKKKVRVPLTITIIFITFYISLGALIYGFTESWTYIQAFYFCLISLVTIGKFLNINSKIKN